MKLNNIGINLIYKLKPNRLLKPQGLAKRDLPYWAYAQYLTDQWQNPYL